MKYSGLKVFLLFMLFMVATHVQAALINLEVINHPSQATIKFIFDTKPDYRLLDQAFSKQVVLELRNTSNNYIKKPLAFKKQHLVQKIHLDSIKGKYDTVVLIDLKHQSAISVNQYNMQKKYYIVEFNISTEKKKNSPPTVNVNNTKINEPSDKIIIAIDAGHGGQDPGAIGASGLYEKTVTLAIAYKLKALFERDPQFTPVLTRTGDYFISVMGRSEVARKKKANLLISIHADAAPNKNARGASVWILSSKRANSELGRLLEQHEKQSELLGGAGNVLANTQSDPYLSQAVIDLQFGHSQRVGFDVAAAVLRQLRKFTDLHKYEPESASLGVLRSPDIPSILVETGFISNHYEEKLLGKSEHQDKIARGIYEGVKYYFNHHPMQSLPKENRKKQQVIKKANIKDKKNTNKNSTSWTGKYKIKQGDTLLVIAKRYSISVAELKQANGLISDTAVLGKMLKVPNKGAK